MSGANPMELMSGANPKELMSGASETAQVSRAPGAESFSELVLEVSRLNVGTSDIPLVKEVDLTIRRGERVGLIGESGSGKTLTALAVMGLLPEGVEATGSARLAGVDHELIGASERRMAHVRGRVMSMVFQEPMTALNPAMRVGAQVAEVMTIHETRASSAARDAAVDLLGQVGLPDPARLARAYPHQLSGGQRQRVVLAIALANDPPLLICDEPTTALDVTVQAQVLELIVSGVEARDAALLFITHDLAVVASVCERVLVMYGGRVVEAGPVGEVLTAPRHPYTQGLLSASDLERVDDRGRLVTIPGSVPPAGRFPAGCVFRNRCPRATEVCETVPPWTRDGPIHGAVDSPVAGPVTGPVTGPITGRSTSTESGFACFHPLTPAAPEPASVAVGGRPRRTAPPKRAAASRVGVNLQGGAIISVRDLRRDYRRPRASLLHAGPVVHALRGVGFEVDPGERFGIVGESGSGKSTLLRLLAGLEQPTSGEVNVLGRSLVGARERQLGFLREELQLVFQDPMGSLDPRMRVRDIVAEPLVAQGRRDVATRVAEVLDAVGLSPDAADRYPHQFSGGQRQRISIARALAPDPSILVADEPVSALDVSLRAQVLNLISDLVERLSLTLVFVSHDLAVVRHLCERVAVMHDGEIVELGPTERVYTAPEHPYTQRLVAAVPTLRRSLAGNGKA